MFHLRVHLPKLSSQYLPSFFVLQYLLEMEWYFCFSSDSRRLRTPTNFFISGMAITDFSVGIVMISNWVIRLNPQISLTPFDCLLFWCANVFGGLTSCLTLLLVSLDRYLKVLLPLRYQAIMSNKVAISAVVSLYAYAIFTMYGLPLAGLNRIHKDFGIPCFFQLSKIFDPIYLHFLIFVHVLLPLFLVCVMYTHLFRVVRKKLHAERTRYDSAESAAAGMRFLRFILG